MKVVFLLLCLAVVEDELGAAKKEEELGPVGREEEMSWPRDPPLAELISLIYIEQVTGRVFWAGLFGIQKLKAVL